MKNIYTQLDAAVLRVDAVLLLAGMLNDGEALADPLRDMLDDADDDELTQCFPDMPAALLADRDDDTVFRESFCMWAHDAGKFGFAVKFARPVMTWNREADSSSFSWGRYNTAWFYGDTLAQAMRQGKKWAKARELAEKSKQCPRSKTPNARLSGAGTASA